MSKDEIIEDHYQWRWNEGTHKHLERAFGAVTLGLGAIAYWAI